MSAAEPPKVPVYTYTIIAAIVLVAAIQFVTGLDHSVEVAGFDKLRVIHGHEYWRFLTGAALHGGVMHLFFNSYALYSFGRLIEELSNRAHLAIAFLLSAIGGDVLGLVLQPTGVSIGASGGIVGLLGFLAVYAFVRQKFISRQFRNNLLTNIVFIIGFGVFLNYTSASIQVDNFAHIGGLVTGAVYGFLVIPRDEYTDPRVASPAVENLGLLALGIYLATCLFSIALMFGVV